MHGELVTLRPATGADIPVLAGILATPEVASRWHVEDGDAEETVRDALDDEDTVSLVIEHEGRVVGYIQFAEEPDEMYRHAGIDLYLDPAVHSRGLGTDAVRTLALHLFTERGHHRLVIDPAADNTAAIRAYSKAGFKPVGVMREYERGADGKFHDGLLMEMLASDLASELG